MLETNPNSVFDYPVVCRAEVDLPAWLAELTGKSGWRLEGEEEGELCEAYAFHRGQEEAQVLLYRSGHVMVEVGDGVLYDGHLSTAPGYARMQYYNADSGEPVLLN